METRFTILTSNFSSLENDCACSTDLAASIILGESSNSTSDDDCACSTDLASSIIPSISFNASLDIDCACTTSAEAPPVQTLNGAWQIPPHLTRRDLPGNYQVLFNPLGGKNLAVVNQAVKQVLDAFSGSMDLVNLPAHLPTYERAALAQTARRLIELGLLTASQPQPLPEVVTSSGTLTAWVHVTNACNLVCDYCYVHKSPEKMSLTRGKQAVDAIFRSALAHNFTQVKLKYAGGEPTLAFSLVLALQEYAQQQAARHGLKLSGVVLSNGVRITEAMVAALKGHDLRLAISLDGIGGDHDAQRKFPDARGSFAFLERSLDVLERGRLKPSISITVSHRNLPGLVQTVAYVLRRGLPFSINFYRENDFSAGHADLRYSDGELIRAMQAVFRVIESNLPDFSLLGILSDRARLDAPHSRPCGVGESYLVIDQRGDIARCHTRLDETCASVDDADPLQDVRQSLIGIRNPAVDDKAECSQCKWRNWCAGGCPLQAYRMSGRYDSKSPNCHIYQAIFPEILRLEGLRLLKYAQAVVM